MRPLIKVCTAAADESCDNITTSFSLDNALVKDGAWELTDASTTSSAIPEPSIQELDGTVPTMELDCPVPWFKMWEVKFDEQLGGGGKT
jgi:hypothetical protein